MSVYKDERYNTWYFIVRYKDKQANKTKQYKRRGFEKKKDAQTAEKKFLEHLNTPSNRNLTFEEVSRDYMTYSIGRKKERTIEIQNNLIKTVLIPYFKQMNIHKIKPRDIDDFYRSILDRYTNSSMKNIRRNLSAIMNFAVNFYNLEKNIVNIVELPRKHEKVKLKYWTLEQFKIFEKELRTPSQRALFNILFWSGMRKGEVLALRICDVHLDNGMIDVNKSWNGKKVTSVKNTASERRISVPTHVIDVVKDLIKHKKEKIKYVKKTDYLFGGRYNNEPVSPTNVNMLLKRATLRAGLPEIRVHYLRHSHASLLINAGVSLYVVSRHLGHSDIQTTANTYGHLYPNTENEIAEILNNQYNQTE